MPFTPAEQREYRRKLKEKGVCIRCHDRPAKHLGVTCRECDLKRTDLLREQRRRWYAEGACTECGRALPPDPTGHVWRTCPRCAHWRKLRGRRRRAWRN